MWALACAPLCFAEAVHIPFFLSASAEGGAASVDEKLAADILKRIQKSGGDVGVAFRTLDGKTEWFSRADEVFHAASTVKIPVLVELFHQCATAS
jgi:beta-lactamase class A